MKFILGKKIGMTQIFDENGHVIPVTVVEAEPNTVVSVLTKDKNGYDAVQVGTGSKKLNKPEKGHQKDFLSKTGKGFAFLREFKTSADQKLKRGDKVDVSQFEQGEKVVVTATTKGKGFQGVVKRWNFAGAPKTHGTKDTLRGPGSIGGAYPQRVLKGLKMAGRMGADTKTVKNLKIAYIDKKNNTLAIKGSVPGHRGAFMEVKTEK